MGERWASRRTLVEAGAAVLLVALVLGPALVLPGYTLRGDMVFVPTQPWKSAWLGLDGSVPRAVPMDAIVSGLTQVLPGWLVQRAFLLGPLTLGAVGVARLVAHTPWFARAAAMTMLVWNPWVAERLLTGQWAIVAGYAVLPWVVLATRGGGRWWRIALALGAAAVCSPSSGVMAVLLALGVALGERERRTAGGVLGAGVLVNLPWLAPSVLVPGGISVSGVSFSAFAARAESAAGLLPSLLSLGGIWKSSVVPAERTSTVLVLLAGLLSLVAISGLVAAARKRTGAWVRGLAGVAAVSFLVAALPAVDQVASLLDGWARTVPGLALFRDSHRYLAPAGVALAVGLAEALARVRRESPVGAVVAGLLPAAPLLLLPGLAWGAGGALTPVTYPREWAVVADLLEGQEGSVVVLPWTGSYRGYAWNDYRAVLDPAPRYLPGEVLVDDRILLGDPREPGTVIIPSEAQQLRDVGDALAEEDPVDATRRLRALGVRWVLLELENGAEEEDLPAGRTLYDGPGLRLHYLSPPQQ